VSTIRLGKGEVVVFLPKKRLVDLFQAEADYQRRMVASSRRRSAIRREEARPHPGLIKL
jgi:hypothetical protein